VRVSNTGYTERLWSVHTWSHLKAVWTYSWSTCSGPVNVSQGAVPEDLLRSLPISSLMGLHKMQHIRADLWRRARPCKDGWCTEIPDKRGKGQE